MDEKIKAFFEEGVPLEYCANEHQIRTKLTLSYPHPIKNPSPERMPNSHHYNPEIEILLDIPWIDDSGF